LKKAKRHSSVQGRLFKEYFIALAAVTLLYIFAGAFLKYIVFDRLIGYMDEYITLLSTSHIRFIYSLNEHNLLVSAAYIPLLVLFNFVFFVKASALPDKSYRAISGIADGDYEAPRLPREIRAVHMQAEDEIKNTLKYREYLAQESEQRKNDLVVYLAHDLKTPLTSIIGYLTLLEETPELPVKYRAKYMGITLEKAYRLEQLINEFFDITRFNLQNITLEENRIDLGIMLSQIADEFYPALAEKHLLCRLDLGSNLMITGDADKLSRVFDNLMRNAVNYSYPDTEICIFAHRENGKTVVVFKNKGDKISAQKLDMIFEKFFRADDSRTSATGGAGLGLAIAKQIVELHGGSISAESNFDFTAFTVVL